MAGATTAISYPAASQENFASAAGPLNRGQNPSIFQVYVSPTFKSTPLFAPESSPKPINSPNYHQTAHQTVRTEQPVSLLPIRRKLAPPVTSDDGTCAWGTYIHQYAGIGDLTFLGNGPKTRDLYVARSHRHYLSGLSYVRHDTVTRRQITPFKKSLNREHDDLVLPPNAIDKEKYKRLIEECKFVKEDKYASHQNCCRMFPVRGRNSLSNETEEAIRQLLAKRYGQTTYSENFYDQCKSTQLKLGPQFQFFDDESDPKNLDSTPASKSASDTALNHKCSHTSISTVASSKSAEDLITTDSGNETENDVTPSTSATELKQSDSVTSIASLKVDPEQDNENPPMWPCWPGHMSNTIDPVTLKIAEKRHVMGLEDLNDVRTLPMFQPRYMPDFNILKNLDHATTDEKFAPAKVDFCSSGYEAQYGTKAERANNVDVISIEKTNSSRFRPLPKYIVENVDKRCGRREEVLKRQHPNAPDHNLKRVCISPSPYKPHPPETPKNVKFTPKESTSLEDLEHTLASLREASPPEPKAVTKLPPLWETLTYSSDRVVDHLGKRFKSTAQKRYHNQHPETIPGRLYMPLAGSCKQHRTQEAYASDLTRRRQFYNGYHMGSSYR